MKIQTCLISLTYIAFLFVCGGCGETGDVTEVAGGTTGGTIGGTAGDTTGGEVVPDSPDSQDSDADGIPDSSDACPDTEPGTTVGSDGCPPPPSAAVIDSFDVTVSTYPDAKMPAYVVSWNFRNAKAAYLYGSIFNREAMDLSLPEADRCKLSGTPFFGMRYLVTGPDGEDIDANLDENAPESNVKKMNRDYLEGIWCKSPNPGDEDGCNGLSLMPHGEDALTEDDLWCRINLEKKADAALISAGSFTTRGFAQNGRACLVVQGTNDQWTMQCRDVTRSSGGLEVKLKAASTTSNCRSPTVGGAGITSMIITLGDTEGGCARATFTRTKGGNVVGTYVVSCSAPAVAGCIETDEKLAFVPSNDVPTLESGSYTIHVLGRVGAPECWRNDDSLQVPPQGMTLSKTLNLEFINRAGCFRP